MSWNEYTLKQKLALVERLQIRRVIVQTIINSKVSPSTSPSNRMLLIAEECEFLHM